MSDLNGMYIYSLVRPVLGSGFNRSVYCFSECCITSIFYVLPTVFCLFSYGKYIYSMDCAVIGSGFYIPTVWYTGFMNEMLP